MTLTLTTESPPLRLHVGGVYRVGSSRVSLDVVISAYQAGESPEEIAEHYPTLNLADVYSVIGYYLSHRPEVDSYLETRRQEAEALRRRLEAEGIAPTNMAETLDRLRSRLDSRT